MTKKRGFTLTELLVVISIIGILSAVVMVGMKASRERAKVVEAKADVSNISLAVGMLYADTRAYPSIYTMVPGSWWVESGSGHPHYSFDSANLVGNDRFAISDSTSGLVKNEVVGSVAVFNNWNGPYYKGSTKDPWGNEYMMWYGYYSEAYQNFSGAVDQIAVYSKGEDRKDTSDTGDVSSSCDDIYHSFWRQSNDGVNGCDVVMSGAVD